MVSSSLSPCSRYSVGNGPGFVVCGRMTVIEVLKPSTSEKKSQRMSAIASRTDQRGDTLRLFEGQQVRGLGELDETRAGNPPHQLVAHADEVGQIEQPHDDGGGDARRKRRAGRLGELAGLGRVDERR